MRSRKFSWRVMIAILLIAILFFANRCAQIACKSNDVASVQSKGSKNSFSTVNLVTAGLQGGQGHCIPNPNQPLAKLSHVRKRLDEPRIDPGEVWKMREVACFFLAKSNAHFPHAMQQLYRCFSYWQDYYDTNAELVFLLPQETVYEKLSKHPFISGIFDLFEQQLEVDTYATDVLDQQGLDRLRAGEAPTVEIQSFDGIGNYSIRHVHYLHYYARHQFKLDDSSSTTCKHTKPRIAILNRVDYSRRSILNAPQLANHTKIKNLSRNNIVDVKYFEEADFREQVTFFRSVDILISPHGAQLTGVAFMNAPCSHVLELFPKGYSLPGFFGSLVLESGKDYSYLYMSENPPDGEQATRKEERTHARAQDLCPSADTMVDTIRKLVDEWRQCCDVREMTRI